jgi:hypothetical protein
MMSYTKCEKLVAVSSTNGYSADTCSKWVLYEYTAKNMTDKSEVDQLIGHRSTPDHRKRYAFSKAPVRFSERFCDVYVVHN